MFPMYMTDLLKQHHCDLDGELQRAALVKQARAARRNRMGTAEETYAGEWGSVADIRLLEASSQGRSLPDAACDAAAS